jgi:uncharacterized protein (UPF0335 family)
MSTIGHNSPVKSFIERVVRLEEEKAALGEDISEVYKEAKGAGFDTKILRKVVRKSKMTKAERQEEDDLTEAYMRAAGMLD